MITLTQEQTENILWKLLDDCIRGGNWIDEIKHLLDSLPFEHAKDLINLIFAGYDKYSVFIAIQEGNLKQSVIEKYK